MIVIVSVIKQISRNTILRSTIVGVKEFSKQILQMNVGMENSKMDLRKLAPIFIISKLKLTAERFFEKVI
jgi:hypothetical protein